MLGHSDDRRAMPFPRPCPLARGTNASLGRVMYESDLKGIARKAYDGLAVQVV